MLSSTDARVATASGPWWRWLPLAAALAGLTLHTWLLIGTDGGLLASRPLGDFYDAQVRAWFDGHWHVPAEVAGLEGIVRDGRTYIYFGVVPSILRLPVLALTDSLDGRLSQLSVWCATAVATAAGVSLWWRLRALVSAEPPGFADHVRAAAVAAALPAGSTLLFLASRPGVYHEASAWGVAFTLWCFVALLDLTRQWSRRGVVLCGLAAAAAVSSRPSVGLAAIAAVALVAVAIGAGARTGVVTGTGRRLPMLALGAAAAGALVSYSAVMWIRFRTLFGPPLEDMVFAQVDEGRASFLERHDGFFGLEFVPTTLVQYWRPNGLDITAAFPFVDFGEPPGPVIGGTEFDLIDHVASVPATMPAAVVLAVLGVVTMARDRDRFAVPALLTVGALAGLGGMLAFGYIAHRYTADALPLVLVPALVALATVSRRSVVAVVAALGVAGVWINLALGLTYQRLWSPDAPPHAIASFLELRHDVAGVLGVGRATPVVVTGELPAEGRRGDLAVVGDCDGLYLHDGLPTNSLEPTSWVPVERTERTGWRRYVLSPPATARAGDSELLVAVGEPGEPEATLWLDHLDAERVRLRYEGAPFAVEGPELAIGPDGRYVLDVALDRLVGLASVDLDGSPALRAFHQADSTRLTTVSTTLRPLTLPEPRLCRALLD